MIVLAFKIEKYDASLFSLRNIKNVAKYEKMSSKITIVAPRLWLIAYFFISFKCEKFQQYRKTLILDIVIYQKFKG